MKQATLVVSQPYQNNRIFNREDAALNRDDCLAPFMFLKDELEKHGYALATQDINPISESEFTIYNEMPKRLPPRNNAKKSFLLILESPLIVKNSWHEKRHLNFNKIFTWNDDVIDGKRFIKVNYAFDLPTHINKNLSRSKLCTLISAHKLSSGETELYSERINSIRWFEENAPADFDLYGIGWDKPAFQGLFKVFKRLQRLAKLFPFTPFPSYKGKVDSKKETLEKYSFAICYENITGLNGYITEKIFDCLFAGTIPIYWGADNIRDYIPEDCFIDRRKFKTHRELYNYIKSMSADDRQRYFDNIERYLQSDKAQEFHVFRFAKTVSKSIIEGLS